MEVNILVQEKNVLEIELKGGDRSLVQILAEKLNQDKDVEFAAFKVAHPLVASPRLIVRTKKGDATKLLLKELEVVKKEVVDFRKQFTEIVK